MEKKQTRAKSTSAISQWTGPKPTLLVIAAAAAVGALAGCDRAERAWSTLAGEPRDPSTYGMPAGTPPLGPLTTREEPPVQEISREELMAGDRAQQLAREIRRNMGSQFGCSQMADNIDRVADSTNLPLPYRINTISRMADNAARMGCLQ